MKSTKILKILGTGLQVLGAIGGTLMAGFEIAEGIGKINSLRNQDNNDDSVAPETTEVEA